MNRLAELRTKAGYSQENAARKIGVERSTIAKWETSVSFPRGNLLPVVAKVYNCKIEDFYEPEGDRKDGAVSATV